jgi:hypothetical protein
MHWVQCLMTFLGSGSGRTGACGGKNATKGLVMCMAMIMDCVYCSWIVPCTVPCRGAMIYRGVVTNCGTKVRQNEMSMECLQ